jgi:HEAT repeat protein
MMSRNDESRGRASRSRSSARLPASLTQLVRGAAAAGVLMLASQPAWALTGGCSKSNAGAAAAAAAAANAAAKAAMTPSPISAAGGRGSRNAGTTGHGRTGPCGADTCTPTRANAVVRAATTGVDIDQNWWTWWELNKLRYLRPNRYDETRRVRTSAGQVELPAATRASAVAPGSRYAFEQPAVADSVADRARADLLPDLQELLRDRREEVRAAAATALGRLAGRDAVPRLLPLLDDNSRSVREAAVLALGATGSMEAAAALQRLATQGHNGPGAGTESARSARPLAIVALGLASRHGFPAEVSGPVVEDVVLSDQDKHADVGVAGLLFRRLADDTRVETPVLQTVEDGRLDMGLRCRAVESLRSNDDPALLRTIDLALNDEDVQLRRSAALALGTMPHPGALVALKVHFASEAEEVLRGYLLLAIGEQGGAEARAFLRSTLLHGDKAMEPWAALALGSLLRREPDAGSLDALRAAADKEATRDTRLALAVALGLARDPQSLTRFVAQISDAGDPSARAVAAQALGLLGGPAARDALADRLERETDAPVRVAIAQSLGCIGDLRDAPALLAVFRDLEIPQLRQQAALALGYHASQGALDGLLEMVRDARTSGPARAAALDALGLMLDPQPGPMLAELGCDTNFEMFPDWLARALTTSTL